MINKTSYPVNNPLLTPFIRDYFALDFSDLAHDKQELAVPPVGFPVLQFNYGVNADFYRHKQLSHQSVFIGQFSRHVLLYPSRGMKILGVNFKPYGLYNLLGIKPSVIYNSAFESSEFFGHKQTDHIVSVLRLQGEQKGIEETERLLLSTRDFSISQQGHFDRIVDLIENRHGLVNYTELLTNVTTRRTFQRYFREVIGISPKLFARVLRHKYIMELMYKNPCLKWSDILLDGFYYDNAHFNKDFIAFTGLTPKSYSIHKNCFASALLES